MDRAVARPGDRTSGEEVRPVGKPGPMRPQGSSWSWTGAETALLWEPNSRAFFSFESF